MEKVDRKARYIRTWGVVLAELSKLVSHPATVFAIASVAVTNVLLAVVASSAVRFGTASGMRSLADISAVMFAPIYLFLVLSSYGGGSEYQCGQIRLTLWAVPRRGTLAFCKAAALLVVALPGALLGIVPGRVILGLHRGASVGETILQICLWSAAYVLMSFFVFGLAVVSRSVVVPLAVMVGGAVLINAGFVSWPEGVRLLPDQAAMSMLGTPSSEVTALPPAVGAMVLSVWVAAALGASVFALRRDS